MGPRLQHWALVPWVRTLPWYAGRDGQAEAYQSGLSAFYGKPEADEERFKVLDRAYELGETNWDSADICKKASTFF